ncbi:MAG: bifunctional prephenate dehydrogenase/3-phosphoshikimate 1-carboxyvinyltransferase [Cellvibrionales bacterium TMED49]|nr:bifunctional prephenate dehydrogenase/3-phosphoshikimate 1-carboxyvinyltransferase [Porticoccaceae bacterium]OUU39638.1 MAG: bifunctional prephenate dehydrogenase/3-phosphoshikimate 1-carboxyvinyltransferase [Cellvibrionales bacterium TMED49]
MSYELSAEDALFNRIVIIGLGLIGASIALAAKKRKLCYEVIGLNRKSSSLMSAKKTGVIDRAIENLSEISLNLNENDLILICVPTLEFESVLKECRRLLRDCVTITDVCSVKGYTVDTARAVFGFEPFQYVPGHPIAGSEKSGLVAAAPELFANHLVILTPTLRTGEKNLERVKRLWEGFGAFVCYMDTSRHDEILASTSHLPHMLAYSLVATLASRADYQDIFRFAAGGFKDFTRIAASDPIMWRDIALTNRRAIVNALDHSLTDLHVLRNAIESCDSNTLMEVFTRAQGARKYLSGINPHMFKNRSNSDDAKDSEEIKYVIKPGGHCRAELRIPGDKSISHRSLMFGALAEGLTSVTGFLEGEDTLATLQAFRDMGVVVEGPSEGRLLIHGVGLNGLRKPTKPLYLGNSGTSMRLLSGLLVGQDFDVEMVGDISLSRRPMNRIAIPLKRMGAIIETLDGGLPPVKIRGGRKLNSIEYQMPIASAQVKSSILFASLYVNGESSISEPAPTRDHTERMLKGFGCDVRTGNSEIIIRGGTHFMGKCVEIPSDISSAAFFMVAAAITPGSSVLLKNIGVNPTRVGVVNILRMMGADIEFSHTYNQGEEPVADIQVKYSPLVGIDIPKGQVALAIDEFPVIFVAAACASGATRLSGATELRVKESDRIKAMSDGLTLLGIEVIPAADGLTVIGGVIGGGEVDSLGDHRIAMAFSIAALRATSEICILNCNNVATSFPTFVQLARQVGLDVVVESQ